MSSRRGFVGNLVFLNSLSECDRVSKSLCENELDEDFKSCIKKPVIYTPNLPLLKTAAESYTRMLYKELEEEFKM
jgi:hypothetical protein